MVKKILIVDDDREFRRELIACLEGYSVLEASNGKEALDKIRKPNDIGLVFLDIRLPEIDGLELLTKIKKIDPALRIIIITGYGSKEAVLDSLHGHADDYIEKPLDVENIKEIVGKFLIAGGESEDKTMEGKIKKIKNFVEANVFKKMTLLDAAKYVCLSPKYLSRVFKEITGEKFTDYRLKIKIDASKRLLLDRNLSIEHISDKLGYKNTESFIRQFKKNNRNTPTEFRRKTKMRK